MRPCEQLEIRSIKSFHIPFIKLEASVSARTLHYKEIVMHSPLPWNLTQLVNDSFSARLTDLIQSIKIMLLALIVKATQMQLEHNFSIFQTGLTACSWICHSTYWNLISCLEIYWLRLASIEKLQKKFVIWYFFHSLFKKNFNGN